jgi:hypothetical protein
MNGYSAFYEERLYPLQDGILDIVARSRSRFYLTGGTAIGRAWFGHRYSDDLDLFVNGNPEYASEVAGILRLLEENAESRGYAVLRDRTVAGVAYTQINVSKGETILKIDLVDDVASHVGSFVDTPLYPRVDNLRNMLSNKLSALYRYEPKDVADIWVIAKHATFSWRDLIAEAREKELGLDAPQAAEVVRGFPEKLFDAIKWRQRPDLGAFTADIRQIALDILRGGANTVALAGSSAL